MMKTNSKALIVILCIFLFSVVSFAENSATVIEVNEGELVNLKIKASDVDEDKLLYTYDPPLNSSGQWQTTYGDFGEWETAITVSDGKANTVKSVVIKVYKSNRPPVLDEIEDIIVNEGDTVVVKPSASDEEGDDLTYTISAPVGNDGEWDTTYEDAGEYLIEVGVTDGLHDIVMQEFFTIVEDVNRDPSIEDYSPEEELVEMGEDEEMIFLISGEDSDGDVLSYSWELDGEEVSTESEYTYVPNFEDAGTHVLKGSVSDENVIIGIAWAIEVKDVNRAPVLEEVADITVNEGELVVIDFDAKDPDGDDIRYSLSDPVGDNKEWQTGFEDAGIYEIELIVSDGEEVKSGLFYITVNDVDRAPDFEEIEDVTLTELESVKITLEASDPDGDDISFSAEDLPLGATMVDNVFTFSTDYTTVYKPHNFFTSVLKFLRLDNIYYGSKRTFPITFIAAGKDKVTEQVVNIIVDDENRAPVLFELEDISVNEGEVLKIVPKATEYDNDRVKFYLSWPIGNDGKWKPNYGESGFYNIQVTASDGKTSDTKNFTLTVNNVNRAPELRDIEALDINEGEEGIITPIVSDPDGQDIELTLEAMPTGAKVEDNVFSWTPSYDIVTWRGGTGSYKLAFTASDGEDEVSKETVVTVNDVNRAPEFKETSSPKNDSIAIYEGSIVTFRAIAEDADADKLSYTWKFGAFDKVKDATPILKRKFISDGDKKVTVIVSDGIDEITKTWNVKVVERKVIKKIVAKVEVKEEAPVTPNPKTFKMTTYVVEHQS